MQKLDVLPTQPRRRRGQDAQGRLVCGFLDEARGFVPGEGAPEQSAGRRFDDLADIGRRDVEQGD